MLLVLDDVQWAEPAFLDLIEYLAGWTRDAPILVCCLARSDLAELRPAWAGTPTIQLAPLQRDDARQLLENLAGPLDEDAADAVGRATGGNPLFLEEMLRMLVEEGVLVEREGRLQALTDVESIRVPETVQAVLAARLDRLEPLERSVLQRAAVIGQVFWWGAVADLTPPEEQREVAGALQALVRKGLIRPGPRTFAGEDALRLRPHPRTRRRRTTRCRRASAPTCTSAAPTGSRPGPRHRRSSTRSSVTISSRRTPIGSSSRRPASPRLSSPLGRPSGWLVRDGRALARDDAHAAANLLGRAAALRPGDAALLVDQSEAYFKIGDFARAEASELGRDSQRPRRPAMPAAPLPPGWPRR